MEVNRTRPEDLQRLNALIDGELPPAEHAALAERIAADRELAHTHATLARLKACIVEGLDAPDRPAPQHVPVASHWRWPRRAAAVLAATVLAAGVVVGVDWLSDDEPQVRPDAAIVLAALPATPIIPDLAIGGLTLVGTEVETLTGGSVLVAAYRGPRGCRLELRVYPSYADMPPTGGTRRRTWTVGQLAYELAAFGMPAARFAAVADAAQAATRAGRPPEPTVTRMREARRVAPPCVG